MLLQGKFAFVNLQAEKLKQKKISYLFRESKYIVNSFVYHNLESIIIYHFEQTFIFCSFYFLSRFLKIRKILWKIRLNFCFFGLFTLMFTLKCTIINVRTE